MSLTKFFLSLLITFFIITTKSHSSEIIRYTVPKGALHTGGNAEVRDLEIANKFVVNIKYQLKKKALVPIDENKLKGETEYELPVEFKTERGYQELEALKNIELEEANLKFIKRGNYLNYKDAYYFEVQPKNGKSIASVIYHPNLYGIGWVKIDIYIIINKLGIDRYQITLESIQ